MIWCKVVVIWSWESGVVEKSSLAHPILEGHSHGILIRRHRDTEGD
jgi:hypothetical protein